MWESDISSTYLIFCLKCSTDVAFFKLLGVLYSFPLLLLRFSQYVGHLCSLLPLERMVNQFFQMSDDPLVNYHGPAVREASFQIIGAWFGQGQSSLRVSSVVSRVTLREKTLYIFRRRVIHGFIHH